MPGNTEILDYGATGATIYALARSRSAGTYWNGAALEAYTSAHYATYAVAMPEQGASSIYIFTAPAALPAGDYDFLCRLRAGATPAETDDPVGEVSDTWDGTNLSPIGGGGGVAVSRYSRYPTGADLSAFLSDAGVTVSGDRADAAVLAGIEDLENSCMRHFLAGFNTDNTPQAAYTRVFDPATIRAPDTWGALLDFGAEGDLAQLDSVQYQLTGGTAEVWAEGTQYRKWPQNAMAMGHGIAGIEIRPAWWRPLAMAQWGSIQVAGLWGYATKIAPDVWQAFLANAALMFLSSEFHIGTAPAGLKSWTGPGGIKKEYDTALIAGRFAQWQKMVNATIPTNGRWAFG